VPGGERKGSPSHSPTFHIGPIKGGKRGGGGREKREGKRENGEKDAESRATSLPSLKSWEKIGKGDGERKGISSRKSGNLFFLFLFSCAIERKKEEEKKEENAETLGRGKRRLPLVLFHLSCSFQGHDSIERGGGRRKENRGNDDREQKEGREKEGLSFLLLPPEEGKKKRNGGERRKKKNAFPRMLGGRGKKGEENTKKEKSKLARKKKI